MPPSSTISSSSSASPRNVRFKTALLRARIKASQEHFSKGQRFHEAQVLERALIEFQEAVQLDPTNQYAAGRARPSALPSWPRRDRDTALRCPSRS